MLAYSGNKFEDKKIVGEEWFGKEKPTMGPMANVPYLKEGDFVLTESSAICYYLAEKHGLMGETLLEKVRVKQAAAFFADWRMRWLRMCFGNDFEKQKEAWLAKDLPEMVKRTADLLGDKDFFCGKLSWADFEAHELLFSYKFMEEKCLDEYPTLKAFMERFENLPNIKEYMASDGYLPLTLPKRD